MSDFLSQDQIDALLSQDSGDKNALDGIPGGDTNDAGPGKNYKSLTQALELFVQNAQSVCTTVMSKNVSGEIELCDAFDDTVIQGKIPEPALLIKLPLTGGVNGELYAVLTKRNTAVLSDIMMMGDGSAEYNDDHKDAIAELFSQIMGSYTTALGGQVGTPVSAGAIVVSDFDAANLPVPADTSDSAILKVTLEGQSDFHLVLIVPDELSRALMKQFGEAAGEDLAAGGAGISDSEMTDLSAAVGESSISSDDFRETSFDRPSQSSKAPKENVDMLLDVELDVAIELGRANLSIKKILELAPGSIVELDRMAGEPVDLLVNNKVVAKGEVVVVDESFGIRIVSLVSAEDRIRSLK